MAQVSSTVLMPTRTDTGRGCLAGSAVGHGAAPKRPAPGVTSVRVACGTASWLRAVEALNGRWQTWPVADGVYLRTFTEGDLRILNREWSEPDIPGEFQWFGFRPQRGLELERRLKEDGLIGDAGSWLVVASKDGAFLGSVGWRPVTGPNWEIGCLLWPEHRGQGIGTEAQRLLVRYLFDTTPVNRIQAGTEAGNFAEQRALEKAGFRREGVQRGLYFRAGEWRDSVMYGLLRTDWVKHARKD